MINFRQTLPVLMLLSVVIFFGCRKTIDTKEEIFITLNETSLQPGSIGRITADKPISQSSYTATISGVEVEVLQTGPQELLFIVPVISSGNHTLIFDDPIFASTLNVTIAAYTPITDADAVFNNYIAEAEQNITALTNLKTEPRWFINQVDVDILTRLKDILATEWPLFPDDEKIELAYFIVNTLDNYMVDASFVFDPDYYAKASSTLDPGDELIRIGGRLDSLTQPAFIKIDVFGASLFFNNPPNYLKRQVLTASLSVLAEMLYVHSFQFNTINVTGVADTISEPIFSDTVFFSNNTLTDIELSIKFRSMLESDATGNTAEFSEYVTVASQFNNYWDDLSDLVNRLERWFDNTDSGLDTDAINVKTESNREHVVAYNASYISLGNVSNSSITLTTDTVGGVFNVKAVAGAGVQLPAFFTFDVKYEHPILGNSVSKEVQGLLIP